MTYVLTWIARIVPLLLFIGGLVFGQPVLTLGAFLVIFVSVFWPRCKQCGLPTFWQKRPKDPDHFVFYAGNLPLWPHKDCSRCGHDLTM